MRVEQLGTGEPKLAIVGGIHGEEQCGVHAIETLLDEAPAVQRPVKCIIANEPAVEQHVRYIEQDLNRVFPGNPAAETYEKRLAAALIRELRGCTTLSMHSTQSYERPFAIVENVGPLADWLCPQLSLDAVIEVGDEFQSALVSHTECIIEVECGLQGTEQAAENATQLVSEFLRATEALTGQNTSAGTVPVLELLFDHIEMLELDFEEVNDGFEIRDRGLVANRVENTNEGEEMMEWFDAAFTDVPVWEIRKRVDLQRAFTAGKSIFAYKPELDMCDAFDEIAADLEQQFSAESVKPEAEV